MTKEVRGGSVSKLEKLAGKRQKIEKESIRDKFKQAVDAAYGKAPMTKVARVEYKKELVEYYQLEWAVLYSHLSPTEFLREYKEYSDVQITNTFLIYPAKTWYERRHKLQNKITEHLVVRHIDMIAEVQDRHVKASNLALAKATQMLLNGVPMVDKDGNPKKNALGEPAHLPLRSSDVLNVTVALKNVQDIYRKAMGFKDEEGITQIVEKIQMIQVNNTAIQPETVGEDGEVIEVVERKSALDSLSYDEVSALVARARELSKKNEDEV